MGKIQTDKWDGFLKMKFLKQKDDILFYNVDISYKESRIKFLLPRYEPMVGWIEIFGLPPQNEWVFLNGSKKHWQKSANIILYTKKPIKVKENIEIFNNNQDDWRLIKFNRQTGKLFENQICLEDWSLFEDRRYIRKQMVSSHSAGVYFVTIDEYHNPTKSVLTEHQFNYLRNILKERGKPSLGIWLKSFYCWGSPLPIYYKLFPFWKDEFGDFKEAHGSVIEIGYEKEMLHGDWFKLFEIEGKRFEIQEGGWKSREVVWRGKKVKIKDSYEKKIREVR